MKNTNKNRVHAVHRCKNVGKMEFIVNMIHKQKYTARQIADAVAKKFPDPLRGRKRVDKALRFVRAVPWHMKKRGDTVSYLPARKHETELVHN